MKILNYLLKAIIILLSPIILIAWVLFVGFVFIVSGKDKSFLN